MRNLKRALSLALACVMLLGMMATGAGAASNSFTDFDKIVNQEAAEVTSGLGIFDGYTDGSFGPENVVTRAEMAVIICKLLNGSDVDPGNFAGISKFNDVPAWAEGYVNYCASMSIIVGVGEGKFNPSATVTTVEAATMLLKALGYYTEEDQLAADWKTVVTGRATSMHLYGELTLGVDEGLTRDNVAELVFNTLFAQRVAYDDNRHLYVKNTNRDVVVTNGTQDYLNTFAENTFGMWVVDGLVTANSYTNDDLSETTNNGNRTNVVFDTADAQDYPATVYQGSTGSEYPFEYTTGLDMIGHAARVYYKMERNAPVVYAIADRATKVEYVTYDSNETVLSDAANEAGFRRNTIRQISSDDYKVNYAWDVTVGTLKRDNDANNDVDLTGGNKWDRNDPAKTLLVISNSTDYAVDYVILLDQYLDTVKRVATKNDVTEYDLTTIDGVDQNILHGDAAQGDYVIVTDIGKQGDMLNFAPAEKVSANITKITGKSDDVATVKSIVADGTTYVGSPVYDYRPQNSALDDTTDFEAIETIGEATLLLDVQGKCIGLAQPESTPNYAYAAQFGVWHTGGSLNTEFKLTVKLYFLDGTEGVYLVNTEDSASNNTFYNLKLGVDENIAENYRDQLNGEDKANNIRYSPLKTYIPGNIGVAGNTLKAFDVTKESGLGIYKATVRADDTVVLKALGDHEAVSSTYGDETKLIPAHSTFVKSNGQNLTCPADNDVLFQNNKTVYFYVSGTYDDLSVGAKYGVANAVAITNSTHEKADAVGVVPGTARETNDKDNNGENDTFVQILTSDGGRKYEEKKETVEAVLIWGYDLGSSDTLYFYRQNSYDIEHKDNASSRAGEKLYTITYHMYTADGEPYEAHFDNGGKYYDMETAKETVSDKPTGYYKLASKDIEAQWASNETDKIFYVKNNKEIASADGAKNVYVLNAIAKHDTYVDNLYTHIEDVGGIIPSTAKVVSTVDNCSFDSINEIARACDNGALVKISYCYSTSDYKVKTVFITEYNKEGGTIANAGADLWSYYSAPWLYVFNNVEREASYIEVANSARAALEKAGYTVTNMQPAGLTGNGEIYWTMECTMGGVKYNFTNGPTGMGFGTSGFNYYVNIVRETVRVQINGNLASYNNGPIKEAYCVPGATIRVSDKTVATGNVYDILVNNGANFAAANYGQVTAANNQITYALPSSITAGYTVNFKSFVVDTTAVIGQDDDFAANSGLPANTAADIKFASTDENEAPADKGSKLSGSITIAAPAGRALADGTFEAGKLYTLTFQFKGAANASVVTGGNVTFVNATTLNFTNLEVPADAVLNQNNQYEVTLVKIDEEDAPVVDPGKTTVTSVAVSYAPASVEVGDTLPTIAIGDVVPTEAKADLTAVWVKGGVEVAAGAKAEAGTYTIKVTAKNDSTYQVVAGTTAITGTTTLVVEGGEEPPVTSGVVQAVWDNTNKKFKLYAYNNGAAAQGPLSEDDVKAAIQKTTGVTSAITLVKDASGVIKAAIVDGTSYDISTSGETVANPGTLYKMTVGSVVGYVPSTGGKLEGLTGIDWIIPDSQDVNTVAAGKVVKVSSGTATLASGDVNNADQVFAEALELDVTGVDTASDFALQYKNTSGTWTAIGSNTHVKKGTELKLVANSGITSATNRDTEAIIITVNGTESSKAISLNAAGTGCEFEYEIGAVNEGITTTAEPNTKKVRLATDRAFRVTLNGTEITGGLTMGLFKDGDLALVGDVSGKDIIIGLTDAAANALDNTAIVGSGTSTFYKVNKAKAVDGVIALNEAYTFTALTDTGIAGVYTTYKNGTLGGQVNGTYLVAKNATVYVAAANGKTLLKNADGAKLSLIEQVASATDGKNVWTAKFTNDNAAGDVVTDKSVSTTDVATTGSGLKVDGSGTPAEVVVNVTDSGMKGLTTGATVQVEWATLESLSKFNELGISVVGATVKDPNTISITFKVAGNASSSTDTQKFNLTVDGLTMSTTITVAA